MPDRDKEFWKSCLSKAFSKQELLYQRQQQLISRLKKASSIGLTKSWVRHDRAKLIRTNQQLKQLKETKIPYFWNKIEYGNKNAALFGKRTYGFSL